MPSMIRRLSCIACLLPLSVPVSSVAQQTPLEFRVTFDRRVSAQPFSGRVYVMLFKQDVKDLRSGPNWFQPEPFFAKDVKNWQPDRPLVLGGDALGFPLAMAKVPKGTYSIQAVMDFDRGARPFSTAAGNAHSKTIRRELDGATSGPVELKIDQVYKAKPFAETERVKLVDIESKLLTAFHGRSTHLRAGVVLPRSFATEPQRRYPVVYEIPGFSGNHFGAHAVAARDGTNVAGVEMIYVVLDPECRLGHHVFADSANNGPCGRALIEELIPYIEQKYRALGSGLARFVTGHSSGGWSSLWLQITYPDHFNGVWSTSPDPVDLRDFQRIDLTKPDANMFLDAAGEKRPIARRGGKAVLFYKPFSDMEEVMGHGGQLASFEAVFSARRPDGRPRKLWDRTTGAIDPDVAKSWERYDIRLVLERNWKTLGPKLDGKLHVWTGGADTFYLEGAVARLKESLAKLGSDANVEIVPGRDHGLRDKAIRERIAREMAERFRRTQPRTE
ncbi:MAG TPA: alpha/beta hydrolase-fold protein [Gemmataceae bacterium]|jgi:pimeloyl-ACP methyl ester carboxylesterase